MFKSLWTGLGQGARIGLIAGVVVILAAALVLAYWFLHTDYRVLFADLSAPDAAAMTHELDQMKVPYRLDAGGTSILVNGDTVHETRLKLMGKDLPLHGAVGFELFDNSDFGMTEFAQKVNYQRALQGELTRTILSVAEVESVRVHLAFPEEGLFKRDQSRAKASITLALRRGQTLRREQVRGIQRLVAAAVPGIQSRDVTLISEQGVALTQDSEGNEAAAPSLRMELKREIEQHLVQKANAVLEKAFGAGQALASVDVTLDMQQVKVTREDVTTPPAAAGDGAAGVVIRERETVRDANGPTPGGSDAAAGSTTNRELDYQVGRRVEQIVSNPGAISRLQAVAILRAQLSPDQVELVKKLLGGAVGATPERGDSVVVQSLDGLAATVAGDTGRVAPATALPPGPPAANGVTPSSPVRLPTAAPLPWDVVQGMLVVLAAAALAAIWVARRAYRRTVAGVPAKLSEQERQASLAQLRAWLEERLDTSVEGGAR